VLILLLGLTKGSPAALLVRLLGRLIADAGRSGTPKDNLFRWVVLTLPPSLASSSFVVAEVLVLIRLRLLRTVTEEGTLTVPSAAVAVRGELRGEFLDEGGSFDRTECTLSSIFCILPIRPLIWYNEPDLGSASAPLDGLDGGGPIFWLLDRVGPVALREGPRE